MHDPVDIDMARYLAAEREDELASAHMQKQAAERLRHFFRTDPSNWCKPRSIAPKTRHRLLESCDSLLSDAMYAHEDEAVLQEYEKLMCSPAAAPLIEAVIAVYSSGDLAADFVLEEENDD